ncbi:MAG: RICIN domain-containing protein [Clostridia bacterium]|nr:RICIN domain-containing protein [Clostridia bacterium]
MSRSKFLLKAVSLILVLTTVFGIFTLSASAASYSCGTYVIAGNNGSNVRKQPSSNSSRVGAATKGTTFEVTRTSGEWGYTSSIKCTNGYRSGWVSLRYCTKKAPSVQYFNLYYNSNGGSGAPSSVRVAKNAAFNLSQTMPYRSGYSFLGWHHDRNASTAAYAPGQSVSISANTTIYAIWARGSVKTSYSSPLSNAKAYYISPACAPGSVIDVSGGNTSADTNIHLWQKANVKNQQWKAYYYGSGYYYFIDSNSGLALDVHTGLALNGKNISLWPLNKSNAQLFRLIPAGNGYYYIQSKLNPAYYIDINGAHSSNGTNVQLYQGNFSSAQKFSFTAVSGAVINPTSVSLNTSSVSLNAGSTKTLSATVYPSNATNKSVSWSSSNTSVASVSSSGTITAKNAGTATITVRTSNGKTATCKVTVKAVSRYSTGYYAINTGSGLYVRKGPSSNYSSVGAATKGTTFYISQVNGSWGFSSSIRCTNGTRSGWVCLDYCYKTSKPNNNTKINLNVPLFKQGDSRWKNVYIGTKTIGAIGCTTTCISMVYSYNTGKTVYPNEVMKKLSYSNNDLYWSSISNVGLTSKAYNCRVSNSMLSTIYSKLKSGRPVIIGATTSSGGSQHWVVIKGYNGTSTTSFSTSDFIINDPGGQNCTTLSAFLANGSKTDRTVIKRIMY